MTPRASSAGLRWVRSNALSLAFAVLLVLTLIGQSMVGLAQYNSDAAASQLQEVTWGRYVTSSSFVTDVAENWQSEYLQFILFILFAVWLVQRGSSESKKPGEEGRRSDQDQLVGAYATPDSPPWVRAGGWRTGVYSHSLVIMMTVIFLGSWAAQAIAGHVAFNEEQLRELLAPVSLGEYLVSADFWNRTLQNWQSEFLAVGSMTIFAIYLRERGSPQSKKVGAPHGETSADE